MTTCKMEPVNESDSNVDECAMWTNYSILSGPTIADSQWTRSQVNLLIDLYAERPVLWDTQRADYNDKSLRKVAYKEMEDRLDRTEDEIRRKINIVRRQFANERIRMTTRNANGTGLKATTKWWGFEKLRFLEDHTVPPKPYVQRISNSIPGAQKRLNVEPNRSDEEGSEEGSSNPTTNNTPDITEQETQIEQHIVQNRYPRKKRTRVVPVQDDEHTFFENISDNNLTIWPSQIPTVHEDEDDVFGKHVANEIRAIDDIQAKRLAKLKIQNILYQAQCGTLQLS